MYSLAILTSFFSIWCLYALSEKVDFTKKNITLILSQNIRVAKVVALVFFLISTIVLCISLGTVTGLFCSLLIWTLLASAILLFAPFQKVKHVHVIFLGLLIISTELLFTIYLNYAR
ncbi:hypothetical protein [Aquimarina sp. I32.4]|uniref:hypothetical protein n=1 Tax=Aquimarina sp. I32.4 TaxID=2053903 RepID=UPI000CDE94E3|nr:hypothetical protein [Aquimarina sp. I32.4]